MAASGSGSSALVDWTNLKGTYSTFSGTAFADSIVPWNTAFASKYGFSNIIYGGDGNDVLSGTDIYGYNDPINNITSITQSFVDYVFGENGDDYIYGSFGRDVIRGGAGFNTLDFGRLADPATLLDFVYPDPSNSFYATFGVPATDFVLSGPGAGTVSLARGYEPWRNVTVNDIIATDFADISLIRGTVGRDNFVFYETPAGTLRICTRNKLVLYVGPDT